MLSCPQDADPLRTLQYSIAAPICAAACGAAFCAAALLPVMVIVNMISRPIQRRASVTDTVAVELCHERAGIFEEPWDIEADMELATVSATSTVWIVVLTGCTSQL